MAEKRKLDPPSSAAADDAGDDPPSPASEDDNPLEQDAPADAVPNPAGSNGSADPISEPASDSEIESADDSETESEADELDSLRYFLNLLPREQILQMVLHVASRHADVAAMAAEIAGRYPCHSKVLVHGLSWDTTPESLAAAFSSFGEIEQCEVVLDNSSGRFKMNGFVLFSHRGCARAALRESHKCIGNRMVACQLASARPVS